MEKIRFSCLFGNCNFTATVEWPNLIVGNEDLGLANTISGASPLVIHHQNTRIELSKYRGLGTGHGKFKGILPNGNEIKVGVSGDVTFVEEGSKYLNLKSIS